MTNMQGANAIGPKRMGGSLQGRHKPYGVPTQATIAWINFRSFSLASHSIMGSDTWEDVDALSLNLNDNASS
jgi:hypothetical protein